MKVFAYVFLLCVFACEKSGKRYIPDSSGRLNNIAIVSEKALWQGRIGDSLRHDFQKSLPGLPTKEPMFSLHHIPTNIFKDNTRISRNIIALQQGKTSSVKLAHNAYAKPQNIIYITGINEEDILQLLKKHSQNIKTIFRNTEFRQEKKRIKKRYFRCKCP